MKKVLIITYYWPPAGGPGVQRVLKLTKYLPRFGWQPIVLTVEGGDYPALDPSMEEEVPGDIKVFKIPIWEPHNLYKKIMRLDLQQAIPVAVLSQKKDKSFKSRLLHWIRANIFIPDARIGWYFKVINEAKKIVREESVDALFVSSPPHSLQVFGLQLKKKLDIPLISDFRDPWTDIHYYHELKRLSITTCLDRTLEKKVLNQADLILTVSPALKRLLESKSKEINCEVVYNGYDSADFQDISGTKSEKFVISYVGSFKANQNTEHLWKIFAELATENELFRESFCLELTGKISDDVMNSLSEHGMSSFTIINAYKPHKAAIATMCSAAVLLFIIPFAEKNEGILTGKLFDYLASGTPFLAIGPIWGDAAEILNNVSAGPMLDYKDLLGLKNRINELFTAWREKRLDSFAPDKEKVIAFERIKIAEQAAHLMNSFFRKENQQLNARTDLATYEIDKAYFGSIQLLFTVKSFDLQAIRKRYIASRSRSKSGSVERREPSEGGIVYLKIENGQIVEQKVLAKLLEPRGIDISENKLALSSEDKIFVFESGRKIPVVLEHDWLSYIHTVRFNQKADKILVASSGVDTIMEFDVSTGALNWEWLAWEHGLSEGVNPATGEKHILTRSASVAQEIKKRGSTPLLISNPKEERLPTALRAAFMNTAEYGKNNEILATFFHHGWVLSIARDGSYGTPVVGGLSKPHGGMLNKNGYLVTDTAGGRVVLKEGNAQQEFDFTSLPGKDKTLNKLEWLQISKDMNNIITTIDSNRNELTFFNPMIKKRMHVAYDSNWALQEFVMAGNLDEHIKSLENWFKVL